MNFTQHLLQLKPDQYPDEELLTQVGNALRARLRRTGLWDLPPAYLGYADFHSWRDAFGADAARAPVTLDCYLEAIVRRYGSLMSQLDNRKTDIDGLVHLNIKRFILKRQRDHDPVGYAVFKNLEAALNELIADGALRRQGPYAQSKLRNETLLEFGSSSGDPPAQPNQIESALADP